MFVIGTAGHVDHGKSLLVKAMTGIDPDRLEEEKKRGGGLISYLKNISKYSVKHVKNV